MRIKLVQDFDSPDRQGRIRYRLGISECDLVPDLRVWAKTPEQARKVLADYLLNELDGRDAIQDEA